MLAKRQLKKMEPGSIIIRQDDNGRLGSGQEIIIQNLLISTDCDFELISKLTNLPVAIILEIYIKYSQYIDKIIVNTESTEKDNDAIEKCLDLLINHITAIVEYQKLAQTNLLRATDLTNILRILDRLVAIKQTKITQFDKLTGSLVILTAKIKQMELLESGKLELSTDSNFNFTTIADKLETLVNKTNMVVGERKVIYAVSTQDGSVTKFTSQEEAQIKLNIGISSIHKYLDTDKAYHYYKMYSEQGFKEIYMKSLEDSCQTDTETK